MTSSFIMGHLGNRDHISRGLCGQFTYTVRLTYTQAATATFFSNKVQHRFTYHCECTRTHTDSMFPLTQCTHTPPTNADLYSAYRRSLPAVIRYIVVCVAGRAYAHNLPILFYLSFYSERWF